jgi:pimeloyl-ACP methyl ester carboxylesterase
MKTIRTEVLDIAYFDEGPQDGGPLLLLHGWPESPAGLMRSPRTPLRIPHARLRAIAPLLLSVLHVQR